MRVAHAIGEAGRGGGGEEGDGHASPHPHGPRGDDVRHVAVTHQRDVAARSDVRQSVGQRDGPSQDLPVRVPRILVDDRHPLAVAIGCQVKRADEAHSAMRVRVSVNARRRAHARRDSQHGEEDTTAKKTHRCGRSIAGEDGGLHGHWEELVKYPIGGNCHFTMSLHYS